MSHEYDSLPPPQPHCPLNMMHMRFHTQDKQPSLATQDGHKYTVTEVATRNGLSVDLQSYMVPP